MDVFLNLSDERWRNLCDEARLHLNLAPISIEKDFWVCWTLHELCRLPEWGARLTFKGGTSLSKAWNLIERFSEDIDIVIDRDFLGFGGTASPEAVPSKKQRKVRLEALKTECQRRIHAELKPALEARIRAVSPAGMVWGLTAAPPEEDPDRQPLLFEYPTAFPDGSAYVRPVVKIELGARSDTEPAETPVMVEPWVRLVRGIRTGPRPVGAACLAEGGRRLEA